MEKTYNGCVIELGYYHPSDANWSYRVHLIIDETGARLYKETFGGDSGMINTLAGKNIKIEKLSAGRGSGVEYKYKDIKDLPDIESYNGFNWGDLSRNK